MASTRLAIILPAAARPIAGAAAAAKTLRNGSEAASQVAATPALAGRLCVKADAYE
jgi:hypothetical protein